MWLCNLVKFEILWMILFESIDLCIIFFLYFICVLFVEINVFIFSFLNCEYKLYGFLVVIIMWIFLFINFCIVFFVFLCMFLLILFNNVLLILKNIILYISFYILFKWFVLLMKCIVFCLFLILIKFIFVFFILK